MSRPVTRAGLSALLVLGVAASLAPLRAGAVPSPEPAAPDPGVARAGPAGAGTSAWGPIGAPDSTNTSTFRAIPPPTWEQVADFPITAVSYPLKLVMMGAEASVETLDESPTWHRIRRFLPLGPAHVFSGGVTLGGGEGYGGNVSVDLRDFGPAHDAFKLKLGAQSAGDRRATLALRLRRSELSWFELGGGYRSDRNARFFGIGPDAAEDAESFYRREVSWAGATWHRTVAGDYGVAISAMYSGVAATGTDLSDDPHLSQEFAGQLPFGYRRESDGRMAGLELTHENTEKLGPPEHPWRERARPEHGGLERATVSWFEGKGNSRAVYWTWRAEAQQFLPLWHSRRALALRGFVSRQENRGDDPVPFQRMLTNDDPDVFRGYPDERFHDIGIASLTAEYRWPLWVVDNENALGADAYVFADWGQVFAKLDELGMERLAKSYGGGVRLGGHGRFIGRIEVGHSEEGTQFRLRADQLFQYEKGGFFNARSPVPDR